MKKLLIYTIIVLYFSLNGIFAQKNQGSVIIYADSKIDQMMEFHKKLSLQNPGLKGYRVQIFFDSGNYSKNNAKEAEQRFLENYPNQEVYLMFDEPYYKVRVGNFRTQLEAEGFLNSIINNYPNAFVVPDFIEFPSIYDESGKKIEVFLQNQTQEIEEY